MSKSHCLAEYTGEMFRIKGLSKDIPLGLKYCVSLNITYFNNDTYKYEKVKVYRLVNNFELLKRIINYDVNNASTSFFKIDDIYQATEVINILKKLSNSKSVENRMNITKLLDFNTFLNFDESNDLVSIKKNKKEIINDIIISNIISKYINGKNEFKFGNLLSEFLTMYLNSEYYLLETLKTIIDLFNETNYITEAEFNHEDSFDYVLQRDGSYSIKVKSINNNYYDMSSYITTKSYLNNPTDLIRLFNVKRIHDPELVRFILDHAISLDCMFTVDDIISCIDTHKGISLSTLKILLKDEINTVDSLENIFNYIQKLIDKSIEPHYVLKNLLRFKLDRVIQSNDTDAYEIVLKKVFSMTSYTDYTSLYSEDQYQDDISIYLRKVLIFLFTKVDMLRDSTFASVVENMMTNIIGKNNKSKFQTLRASWLYENVFTNEDVIQAHYADVKKNIFVQEMTGKKSDDYKVEKLFKLINEHKLEEEN